MSENHPNTASVKTDAIATSVKTDVALSVPLSLVDYLKAFALYPAGNHRVATNCSRVIELVRSVIEVQPERSDHRFVFQGDEYVTGDVRVPCSADPRLEWLRERFDRCALAGLAFRDNADEESMQIFASRFLSIVRERPKNPQFEDYWEESMLGIEPLERRYDGQYSLDGDSSRSDIAEWLLQGSDSSKVLTEMLRRSSRIANRIGSIEGRLRQLADEREKTGETFEGIEVDVLEQVLKTLPLEALGDGPTIVKVVEEVLARLEESIANSALETGSLQLGKLLGSISQRFFTLTGDPNSPDGKPGTKAAKKEEKRELGDAGDERITDDAASLFEELAELPQWEGIELGEESEEQLGEIYAVYLTFLVRVDEQLALTRIRRLLRGLLSREEAIFPAVAANFLTWCESQAEEHGDWTAFDRFVDLVEEAGCPELLTELGQLELGSLVQRFPRTFFAFVDATDPRHNTRDAEKLHQLLELIDPDRVVAAEKVLSAGIQKKERAEKILSIARPRTLPFVQILLALDRERWMPSVARFISELPTQLPERDVFRLLTPAELPPDWTALYLRALADPTAQSTLRARTSDLIADYLDSTAFDPAMVESRLWAIQLLGRLPCTGSAKALHRILGRKKLFGMKKEDPAIREGAESAIKAIERALSAGGRRV
ncbi:MAG: hypothetical protein H6832_15705 [Planctomycetes bacterium]|nr:hypothetical protein [Planctomycetota bacterium]MCB9919847.1 hypothetical protein [Planctomycetota bacterium]